MRSQQRLPVHVRKAWIPLTLSIIAVIAGLLVLGIWYASTPQFENLVRKKLIAVLEQSTGGRVELQAFHWSLRHLAFEADGLTIHGLEAANEAPYVQVDRIYVRVTILTLLGPKKISLNYLEADRPALHLIIYPDGSTNQPRPRTVRQGKSVTDEIFDLQVVRTEIRDGVVLINQRAIPFEFAAKDFGVVVTYSSANDHYLAKVHAADIVAQRGFQPPVRSHLDLAADIGRNTLDFTQFQLQTGASLLEANASVRNFFDPHWTLTMQGKVDVREMMALAPVQGVDKGTASINLRGQGTKKQFQVEGPVLVEGAVYHAGSFRLSGADAKMTLRMTEEDLEVTGILAKLDRGGTVKADMRIVHWMKSQRQGSVRAAIAGFSLQSVMRMVAPTRFQDLGFDTWIAGTTFVDWTGDASDLSGRANVTLTPSRQTPTEEVPLSGKVDATYYQKNGTVEVKQLTAQTPATQLVITGGMGVYPASRPSTLLVNVETANLGEFDKVLSAVGVAANGKRGVQALPVHLLGTAQFHGTVSGTLSSPDVKGHLAANQFAVEVSGRSIPWDSLVTDAEYSPRGIFVQQAVLTRGKASIQASGQLHAAPLSKGGYSFNEGSTIQADLHVRDAELADVMAIAGSTIPDTTGTINLNLHAGGSLSNLNGGGHLSIAGGKIYGEPYRSLNADLRFTGDEIGSTRLLFLQNGGQLTAEGGYHLRSRQFHFTAQGKGFDFAHLERFKNTRVPLTGQLAFTASGTGTPTSPNLQLNAHLAHITVGNQTNGTVDLIAHTSGDALFYETSGHLGEALLQISGQTVISGDLQTKAQAQLTNFDMDPFLQMFHVEGVKGHSSLVGLISVSGPLRTPRQMQGEAQISQLAVSLGGVPLKSQGALHALLRNGTLHLDPLHITGEDTDLRAQGEAGILTDRHTMNFQAQGSVNVKLLQTLRSDVASSGQITFAMNAGGTFQNPELTGQVKFSNVAMSVESLPNGLSQLNGTLQFTQDRLQVQSLTGTTGGGQVNVTGYITYQQGIYADLTVTGKDIRIRYPAGISSMIDAKLRLQGTQSAMTLGGNIQLTRFSINPNLDFASFRNVSSNTSPPPDPNAFSNHVRLNVHVTSSPDLDFQNSYAKLAGDVDLRIRGTVAQPSVLGRITITEGSATFAGTKYQLQHGDIFFSNPVRIEPVIDIDAATHVEDYDITIGVHGTPNNLTPTFRSEPPLSQQDIFSLLAMGRTEEEQQIYSMQAQQAGVNTTADAILGGALNATLSSRIQKLFGGGSVKIDPSWVGSIGNSTARITVSQQISNNATLTYATNINSTAQQLIQAEVNVTPTVSILAVRDESGVFSLMFKVHKRYQ
ncbi:translocation/assembly module TamB domain-containing protein [Pseudacidobacterium ailaaui]|jgi:translocation and assembly module TamB|uniref:translocation/assembly module TamB domain-containing protein n=1 Tax=Pseudacidobacterium ailaaui TaxID=1382359 RepID=UPI00047EC920|nr:translocation/assembly module TamB domain-containing protein [Pseudacidobacterium ailaaui]